MKTIFAIILVICLSVLISACTQSEQIMQTADQTQQKVEVVKEPVTASQQVFDYAIILSDDRKDIPPIMHLSQDIETMFFVTNKRSVDAIFEIPQLDVYERLIPGESRFISVIPHRNGYYQMQLNSASYGTIQVK